MWQNADRCRAWTVEATRVSRTRNGLMYSGVDHSVVKYGDQGQSGQAIKLFQITPYVNDF